jgi:hypothetical protein
VDNDRLTEHAIDFDVDESVTPLGAIVCAARERATQASLLVTQDSRGVVQLSSRNA